MVFTAPSQLRVLLVYASLTSSRFVADTHALWWYFRSPERLSIAASAVFQLAETGNATVVVPAIVVAEFYYLSVKLGSCLEPSALLEALDSVSGIELSELGRAQLECGWTGFEPEMHEGALDAPEGVVAELAAFGFGKVGGCWQLRIGAYRPFGDRSRLRRRQ